MNDMKIARINELARIKKIRELTPEEFEERELLKKEYIESIRRNLRGQLESIKIMEKDGTLRKLKKKRKKTKVLA